MRLVHRERRPVLLVAAVMLVGVLAGPAGAATPQTDYRTARIDAPDPAADGRWAERVAVAGDLDGDGVNDVFVAVPRYDAGGDNNRGRVYLLSGRTGSVLYRIDSPQAQDNAQFGFFISAFGDANGDGRTDVAIGTDAQDVGGNVDQGKAWAFSGADGSLLYEIDNPEPQANARFGSRIGRAGDVNGDGVPETIVGASNNDVPAGCGNDGTVEEGCFQNEGQAFLFDGRTGAPVRALRLPPGDRTAASCSSNCGSFGVAVQGPGDTDGDGVTDQLVSASSYAGVGRMYLFSGRTGDLLLTIPHPEPEPGSFFGFQDATPLSPGDVTGDGLADLYGNGFLQDVGGREGQGRGWLFNGRTGAVIRRLDDPTPTAGGQFGWSLARTDYNKDGVPDQYIGQSPHHVPGSDQDGGTYVFDGRDGSLLKALEVPAADSQPSSQENAGPRLGWTIAAPGDLNGDGEPDYLGGAPFADVGDNRDAGRLYVFLSSVPARPPAPPSPSTERRGHAPVDRFGGVSAWSVREGDRFFLVAEHGGSVSRLPVEPRGVPFDVDLGPDGDGNVVAAYSRCDTEPQVPASTSRLYAAPLPAYATGRGCDVYRYDFETATERRLAGASTNQASEFLPSIWRDEVAFGRVYEERDGRRGIYPYLYVRALEGGRSDRQPGGSRGATGLPGPTSLDLYGSRLSFVWNYARRDEGQGEDDEGTTEVRLDTVGGGHRVISDADFGDGSYATYLTPKGSNGRITYGFQRVADLEAAQGPRSVTSILLRYRISGGDKTVADPPGTLLGASAIDDRRLLIHVPDRFGPAPIGRLVRPSGLGFVD